MWWLVFGVLVIAGGLLWIAYHDPSKFKAGVDAATDAAKKEAEKATGGK